MPSLKSDLLFWLRKHAIKPNSRLGQCFLISEKALDKIIATAKIKTGEKILEIGAGTGILTKRLLAKGAEVLTIEKDTRLALILHEQFDQERRLGKLKIVQADFLDLPFPRSLESLGWQKGNYKVVANLPYQITSPVIERLLERDFLPSRIVFTVQKEVAERICAKEGELSSLAVLSQACTQNCSLAATFPRSYFYPSPEINSALIVLEGLAYPEGIEIKKLRQVVRIGFSQKRKKLKKNLQNAFSHTVVQNIWEELILPENLRAQELPVEKWVEITKRIS